MANTPLPAFLIMEKVNAMVHSVDLGSRDMGTLKGAKHTSTSTAPCKAAQSRAQSVGVYFSESPA